MPDALDAPDPFADPAFVTRVQKLLAMIASEQEGEADAARRKLMEHLAAHRLSLTDVAQRLGIQSGQRAASRDATPSFTQGAREMGLERQIIIAREARQEAEREAAQLRLAMEGLQHSLQRATFDIGQVLQSRSKMRQRAAIAWGLAAICLVVAVAQHLPSLTLSRETISTAGPRATASAAPDGLEALHLGPGMRIGTVLVQDLAVRLTPYENAGVRAFLNQGTRVVIERELSVGSQTWLLIRSVTGSGWVRAGDVLH